MGFDQLGSAKSFPVPNFAPTLGEGERRAGPTSLIIQQLALAILAQSCILACMHAPHHLLGCLRTTDATKRIHACKSSNSLTSCCCIALLTDALTACCLLGPNVVHAKRH